MTLRIAGTGRALPGSPVTSEALDARLGRTPGATLAACGVARRHHVTTETQVDLAEIACRTALDEAGVVPDLVISGSAVPYQPIPAMAPLVMRRLGISDGTAAAYDVNATCLGFLAALESASRAVMAGQARAALVFASELASRALPWDDAPDTAALFGDGAAAAVVVPDAGAPGMRAVLMRSYPTAYEACGIGAGGTRFDFGADRDGFAAHAHFRMDGPELFRLAARHLKGFVGDLLARAGWTRDTVDLVVPHQASPAALAHMIRQTGFDPDRVVDIVADHGDQIAASIPFALDVARRAGRVPPGSRVLFLGTSAGVTFGGMAWEA